VSGHRAFSVCGCTYTSQAWGVDKMFKQAYVMVHFQTSLGNYTVEYRILRCNAVQPVEIQPAFRRTKASISIASSGMLRVWLV
jgi:hypothetical protein